MQGVGAFINELIKEGQDLRSFVLPFAVLYAFLFSVNISCAIIVIFSMLFSHQSYSSNEWFLTIIFVRGGGGSIL